MNTILKQMISSFNPKNIEEDKMAIKEVIQEVILSALYKAGFFNVAAFYGGTSLRIIYGLDRFSEDLDFSLLVAEPNFDFSPYFPVLESELKALGLNFAVREKEKQNKTAIKTAFAKGNLRELILEFFPNVDALSLHPEEVISIKLEIDTNPPEGGEYEFKYRLLPTYYGVRIFRLPLLFAGKIGALLARNYSNRVKGRDLYDYLFYLSNGTKVNLSYLSSVLHHNGYIAKKEVCFDELKQMLFKRFDSIDYDLAKEDVIPFIEDASKLDIWNAGFFKTATEQYLKKE